MTSDVDKIIDKYCETTNSKDYDELTCPRTGAAYNIADRVKVITYVKNGGGINVHHPIRRSGVIFNLTLCPLNGKYTYCALVYFDSGGHMLVPISCIYLEAF